MTKELKNIHQKFIKETVKISSTLKKRLLTYIASALGFVAGLAWNEAIKIFIDHLFPTVSQNLIIAKFIYAILVSITGGIILYFLEKTNSQQ